MAPKFQGLAALLVISIQRWLKAESVSNLGFIPIHKGVVYVKWLNWLMVGSTPYKHRGAKMGVFEKFFIMLMAHKGECVGRRGCGWM